MRLTDALGYVSQSYSSNRVKTFLSSLGIVVGVIAIVVMLSIGQGMQEAVMSAFGGLGVDWVIVTPGEFGNQGARMDKKPAELDARDVHALENVPGVKKVSPRVNYAGRMTFRNDERTAQIMAVTPSKAFDVSDSIDAGRFLLDSDTGSVVLGRDVADDAFDSRIYPGMRVTITNLEGDVSREFIVAGVLKDKEASVFGSSNSLVFMTHKSLAELRGGANYSYSSILISVEDPAVLDDTQKKMEDALRRLHKDEGFTVMAFKSLLEGLNVLLVQVKYALGGIGAVSLVVGGVGIINVMMLTVTERIKEIGIMKALGATRDNIRVLFLLESGILGFVSGAVGVLVGTLLVSAISNIAGIPMSIAWENLLIGLAFGVITSILAGVYPASKASGLDPVEALRAEQ